MAASDSETISGFLRGDAAASVAIDGWIARAAGAFRSRLGAHWEDLLQDVRLEILRLLRRGSFRGESSLKTYIWRVVNHACLHRLRAQRRWRFEETDFDLEAAREPSPFDRASGREAARLLLRVLARVPENCRELWRMILDGLSYQEMSGAIGVAEGTLRVRVLRCRQRAVAAQRALGAAGGVQSVTPAAGEAL